MLLPQQLQPGLWPRLAFLISEFLIVQQDSASVHRACETSTSFSARILHSSRQIRGRLTTPITTPLSTKSGASASLDKSAQDVDDLSQRLIDVWTVFKKALFTMPLSGTGVSIPAFR